jgi:hypothetical protein
MIKKSIVRLFSHIIPFHLILLTTKPVSAFRCIDSDETCILLCACLMHLSTFVATKRPTPAPMPAPFVTPAPSPPPTLRPTLAGHLRVTGPPTVSPTVPVAAPNAQVVSTTSPISTVAPMAKPHNPPRALRLATAILVVALCKRTLS